MIFLTGLLCVNSTILSQGKEEPNYKKNPNYERLTEMFSMYKTKKAEIVFFGNSLTHGADWSELLGRDGVVGRGIPSDVTEGMLNRIKQVISLKPKICFVMAGINDIYNWTPVEEIYSNYVRIIGLLKANGITPVIQSTLFAGEKWPQAANRNKEVIKLNSVLRKFAISNQIEFIDLNKRLTDNGFLKNVYTWDGVHLNARGYRIWAGEIDTFLKKNNL